MSRETLIAALTALNAADENDKVGMANAMADLIDAVFEPVVTALDKQTTLLEVIAKQNDRMLSFADGGAALVATGSAANGLSS